MADIVMVVHELRQVEQAKRSEEYSVLTATDQFGVRLVRSNGGRVSSARRIVISRARTSGTGNFSPRRVPFICS